MAVNDPAGKRSYVLWALAAILGGVPAAHAQVLLEESFTTPGTRLNLAAWTTETGPPSFFGRTQLQDWVTPDGIGEFVVDSTGAQLTLSTLNPTGFSLYGTHAKTLQRFQPGATSTIEFTTRLQLGSLQPGVVFGMYFYGCTSVDCRSHDEIDIELVTNLLQHGVAPQVQLNRYANEPLGAGNGELAMLPAGFDAAAPHDWTIRWSRQRIDYLVDGTLLATATSHVPQGPMQLNVVAWAPGREWGAAFSDSLQPVSSASQNRSFSAALRSITVRGTQGAIPGTPTRITAVPTGSTLNISWTAPVTGPTPGGYLLTFFRGGLSAMTSAALVAQVRTGPQTVIALPIPQGVRGVFSARVTAVTGEAGLASVPATFTIGTGCSGPPSPPSGLTGARIGRIASVRWNESADAATYAVQAGSTPRGTNLFDGNVGNATAVAGNLDPAIPLFVRVIAANNCGRSAPTADLPLVATALH